MRQIQVDVHWVTGSNPAQGYDIDRSEVEILFCYSNSRAPGGLLKTAYDIEPSRMALRLWSWLKGSQWSGLSPYSRRQIPFIRNSTWSTNVGLRWSYKKNL